MTNMHFLIWPGLLVGVGLACGGPWERKGASFWVLFTIRQCTDVD